MLANGGFLVGGDLFPVLGDEAGSLNGGLLAEVGILVGADDLDQEEEGLGLGVEVLLQLGRDGLDPLRVGWGPRELSVGASFNPNEGATRGKKDLRIWLSWSSVTSL